MSFQQQGPSQPQPCKKGCGRQIHFNKSNPLGWQNDGTAKGRWFPMEYVQTNQGTIEIQHNCPMGQTQTHAPQQVQPSAPAAPSVTQMLLLEQQKTNTLLERVAAAQEGMFNLLKALHPDLNATPISEVAAAEQAGLPPEYQPADEIQAPPE